MIYLEYEKIKGTYFLTQERFMAALDEKEKLFSKTQPKGISYDKESVSSSGKGYSFDDYLIEKEQKNIDTRIEEIRSLLNERKHMLDVKELELRISKDLRDRIYTLKYLEGFRVYKIASKLHYSESQIYRHLAVIDRNVGKMRENATESVIN